MEEEWRPIKGYEGLYEVSNMGRVRSLDRVVKDRWGNNRIREGKIMSLNKKKHGYFHVNLYDKNSIRKTYAVHRLVAMTFIPNPNNLPQINHKDENPGNNSVGNLEWCDSKYNNNYGGHYERVAKSVSGERNGMYGKTHSEETRRKLSKRVYCIELDKTFNSITEAGDELNIDYSGISKVCKGKSKTCGKYHWKYVED